MKQLQDDFTTPEQSKRLLELGVPADSANMYRWSFDTRPYVREMETLEHDWFERNMSVNNRTHVLPCWSVGRLIEIYTICCPTDVLREFLDELNCVEGQVYAMVMTFKIAHENSVLDFSLLED